MNIKRAVILAAGFGNRLRPITEEMPKCLTEINGKPILWHTLHQLKKCGIREVSIVVGYLGQTIIDFFGNRFEGMALEYIWNERYAQTNTMYSTWLARDILEQGAYLIEGDILFTESFLRTAQKNPSDRTIWMVSRFGPDFDGSMSITDDDDRIIDIKIASAPLDFYPDNFFKSTGILRISPQYGVQFSKWLSDEVGNGNVDIYYDLVISRHLDEIPIYVENVDKNQWIEIDSIHDLIKAEQRFQPRKYVIVLMDGAADLGVKELKGKTPLECADLPAIHSLAKRGQTGLVQTMYPGVPVDSIVANMGLLGFYPPRYYPYGRASFEATAQNILLEEDDIAFRCNLVSLNNERQIDDYTANQISTENALKIINNLSLENEKIEIYSGQNYRNILVFRNAGCLAKDITGVPPHTNMGIPIADILLKGKSTQAEKLAGILNSFMIDSIGQIKKINKKYHTDADMLWIWSPSAPPRMPGFYERFGLRGAIVGGLDFIRGIGMAVGMETKEIHGATGYGNTDYKEKLKYAKNFLKHNDLVYIHINAADEESHSRDVRKKVESIEKIDREIVSPLYQYLESRYPDNYRIAVLPDHYTSVADGRHLDLPVPYCIFGAGIKPDTVKMFTESLIERENKEIIKSVDFMRVFTAREKKIDTS